MTHHDARAEMKRPEGPVFEDSHLERHERNGGQDHRKPKHQGQGEERGQGQQMQGMAQMAEQVTRHYDTPAPHSHRPPHDPFPATVMHGLGLSAALGALAGALVGYLLANNFLVIPGWELMYSGAPTTIYTLWTFLGVALGVATVGVGALLTAPAAAPQEQPVHERQSSGQPEHITTDRERAIGE